MKNESASRLDALADIHWCSPFNVFLFYTYLYILIMCHKTKKQKTNTFWSCQKCLKPFLSFRLQFKSQHIAGTSNNQLVMRLVKNRKWIIVKHLYNIKYSADLTVEFWVYYIRKGSNLLLDLAQVRMFLCNLQESLFLHVYFIQNDPLCSWWSCLEVLIFIDINVGYWTQLCLILVVLAVVRRFKNLLNEEKYLSLPSKIK